MSQSDLAFLNYFVRTFIKLREQNFRPAVMISLNERNQMAVTPFCSEEVYNELADLMHSAALKFAFEKPISEE